MKTSVKSGFVNLVAQTMSYEEICDIVDSGMCCAIRAILAPEVCRKLFNDRNDHNRGVKNHTKDFLKKQMASGEFAFNGESVIFSNEGQILDGQHRLVCAAELEISIEILIVCGIDDKNFSNIDTGSVRSNADALQINGCVSAKNTAAALKQVDNYYLAGVIGDQSSRRASGKTSNAEILRLMESHPMIEDSVRRAENFARKCKGLTSPSIFAALHYLFSSVDPTLTEEFIAIVEDGCMPNRKYDETLASAAMKLKRVLENGTRGPRRSDSTTLAAYWVKAWNAFQNEDVPQVFVFRANETFPKIVGL